MAHTFSGASAAAEHQNTCRFRAAFNDCLWLLIAVRIGNVCDAAVHPRWMLPSMWLRGRVQRLPCACCACRTAVPCMHAFDAIAIVGMASVRCYWSYWSYWSLERGCKSEKTHLQHA